MGVMYKITNRVWGISDLPVPVFFGLQAFLVLKWLVYYIGMILLVFTYPFLYIYGVGFLIKTKQKPNWFISHYIQHYSDGIYIVSLNIGFWDIRQSR